MRSQPAIDLVIRPTLQRTVIAGANWPQSRLSRRRPAARLTGPLFCIFVFCTRSRLHRSRPARTHPVHLYCIFTFFGRDSVSSNCVRRQGWIAVCFAFFIFGRRASASRYGPDFGQCIYVRTYVSSLYHFGRAVFPWFLLMVCQLRFFRAAMVRGFGRGPHYEDGNGRTPVGATRAKCRRALSWGQAPALHYHEVPLTGSKLIRSRVPVLRAILSRVFVDG